MTNIEFSDLGLHPQLVQTVAERGYTNPTPIQSGIIPLMLQGKDVLGQAQTGTGKTAAFALPLLHNLDGNADLPQALIVCPTRELAMQVSSAVYQYGRLLDVRVLAVFGGQPYGRQISRLRKGVQVVVGTPGRLLDLIKKGALDLTAVQHLVLDEADEMLSMGFIEDIEAILQETPSDRQTALFSATLPGEIRRLADKYLRDPQSVTIEKQQMTAAAIEQRAYLVNESDKMAALTRLLEMEDVTSALIFAATRVGTAELANQLTQQGYPSEVLNGDLSQDARIQVLGRFRQNQIKMLVATDVAARGLDIEDISHVINYDLPREVESYVHRIGRTGRAGKTGIALSLVTPREGYRLQRIERITRQKITMAELPTHTEIFAKRDQDLLTRMEVWLRRDRCHREKEMVTEMVTAGFDPLDIAAAALKLARAEEKQRPIARITPAQPLPKDNGGRNYKGKKRRFGERNGNGRPPRRDKKNKRPQSNGRRAHEENMERLVLNAGKAQQIRPGDVVGTIAFHADIPGSTLGAIRIQEETTFVDVPKQYVSQVLAKTGRYQIRKRSVTVTRAGAAD